MDVQAYCANNPPGAGTYNCNTGTVIVLDALRIHMYYICMQLLPVNLY